jgi:hypothetical protein
MPTPDSTKRPARTATAVDGRHGQRQPIPRRRKDDLDDLAHWVATALDNGDDPLAWKITRCFEEAAGIVDTVEQPPSPVIGHRFARAHRQLLYGTSTRPTTGAPVDTVSVSSAVVRKQPRRPTPSDCTNRRLSGFAC